MITNFEVVIKLTNELPINGTIDLDFGTYASQE